MKPEIYAYKTRSGGKRDTFSTPIEVDAAMRDPGDTMSGVLGVSQNGGGTKPASKMGNMGFTSVSQQPDLQPTGLRRWLLRSVD